MLCHSILWLHGIFVVGLLVVAPFLGLLKAVAGMNTLPVENESVMRAHPYAQEAQGYESPGFCNSIDKNYPSNP